MNTEHQLINNLIYHPELIHRCKDKLSLLKPSDFSEEDTADLFKRIYDMACDNEDHTPVSLMNALNSDAVRDNIRSLANCIFTGKSITVGVTAEVNTSVDNILESSKRRALMDTAVNIIGELKENKDSNAMQLILEAQNKIAALAAQLKTTDGYNQPEAVATLAADYLEQMQSNAANGDNGNTLTGFESIDDISGGMRPGSLNIIAARPGIGKTALALNIAENVALKAKDINKPVVLFSLEMPKQQIIKRMLSTYGRVTSKQLETGNIPPEAVAKIVESVRATMISQANDTAGSSLYIDDNVTLTASTIVQTVREISKSYAGIAMIVIDYIQLLKPEYRGQNRNAELTETSRTLKLMAMEFNCPVIALSQLNRDIDKRSTHKPALSDLRDSGALEQDADLIMFLSRDSQYASEDAPPNTSGVEQALLSIGKNRHGGIGEVQLTFTGAYSLFEDNRSMLNKAMAQAAYRNNPANYRKQKSSAA